jgi:hypothetical protein
MLRKLMLASGMMVPFLTGARADCVSGDSNDLTPHSAIVSSTEPHTYFIHGSEKSGCPSASAACRARAYVVPNDQVIVTGTPGAYACAWLTNPKGVTTRNWLPAAALRTVPASDPTLDNWAGHWRTGEQDITITRSGGGQLTVKGQATYGRFDPERVKRGAVNDGEVVGTTAPQGNRLAFNQGDNNKTLPFNDADENICKIKMNLVGPYLWALESGCGGAGVSFDGVYARVTH